MIKILKADGITSTSPTLMVKVLVGFMIPLDGQVS